MKPVPNWDSVGRGYKFKQPTFYSSAHLGLDLSCPSGTPVYAPFDGSATSNPFKEGGNVIDFRAKGYVFRLLHLLNVVKTGPCKEGDLIGHTGNTGTLSDGAHLHIDISIGTVQVNNINNFLDPEKFNWEGGLMSAEYNELVNSIQQSNRWIVEGNAARIAEINAVSKKVDALIVTVNALGKSQGLSVADQASVSWLTKVLNAIFSK